MTKIKNLKNAVGAFQRINHGSSYRNNFADIIINLENGFLYIAEFTSRRSRIEFEEGSHSEVLVDRDEENVTMKKVRERAEKAIKRYEIEKNQ